MEQIVEVVNAFTQKIKVKCEDILRPTGDSFKNGIRGGLKLTREQREWLLDPRTINCFRENEWTLEERCEAFRNRFISAPRLACGTMRSFYDYNNVSKTLLYKDTNLRVARVLIPANEGDNKYYILKDDPENIHKLKKLRRSKKFCEMTDQ